MKALLIILFSGLKWGKLAASGGSMLLSLVVYATIWGWRYAAGFIALLFAHEMGHYVLGHVVRSILLGSLVILAGLFFVDRAGRWLIARYSARLGFDRGTIFESLRR